MHRSPQVQVLRNVLEYLSIQKLPQKWSHQSVYLSNSQQQGRSSSIGAKILSFMLRQLKDDFKEENTEKESVQYRKPISYSPE